MSAKPLLFLALAGPATHLLAAAAEMSAPFAANGPTIPAAHFAGSSLTLLLFDDFSGAALNTSLWAPRVNQSHCSPCEPQLYMPGNLAVSNSSLVITTQREDPPLLGPDGQYYNFSSGWVSTLGKFDYLFGIMEASMQLPPVTATGSWPAFWSLPSNTSICWPEGGEIDAMEYAAGTPFNQIYGTLRWGTQCGNDMQPLPGAGYPAIGSPPIDWSAGFHTFSALWNSSAITFYVDGNAYETKVGGQDGGLLIPQSAQYLILNTAIAFFWPPGETASYPAETRVDWVKVWGFN